MIILSDLLKNPKYDCLNINEKRDVVSYSEESLEYENYLQAIETGMANTEKMKIYNNYVFSVEMILNRKVREKSK